MTDHAQHHDPATASPKTWSGRFTQPVAKIVQTFTASVNFDQRLAPYDIEASLAHARMLHDSKIINAHDLNAIETGLAKIREEIQKNKFVWSIENEDVHSNIEKRLIELIGAPAKRLHTARSRNDQVATDIRLYVRHAIDELVSTIHAFQKNLLDLAEQHAATPMPGFTHLQVAQPVSFGHHLMAYYEMFKRDAARLKDCRKRVNELPLGAAALAGTSFPINRELVATELGFTSVCHNSLDAVSDRDFAIEFCNCCALIMMHLSRLSEELILWMNPGFNFVSLSDAFCTGSSIMPQKKNPDVPELTRGKTGRVYGHLIALLTLMKSQPLAYNKDNQEDKEPLFDTIDTVYTSLTIFVDLIKEMKVNTEAMYTALAEGFATATDLADYLVKRGLAFRDAHEAVAQIVRHCEKENKKLWDLTLAELKSFSASIEADVFKVLSIEGSLTSRNHIGGTAPEQVVAAIKRARREIGG